MLKLVKTDSCNPDFIGLVEKLDAYLKVTDGDEHAFYNQYNSIDVLKHCVIAYENETPVACGAFKQFDTESVEIKRMYTKIDFRGKGFAKSVLEELEHWAKRLNYNFTILETGKRQTEAVHFYKKCNYQIIPNYGQYKNIENSVCFKKSIK